MSPLDSILGIDGLSIYQVEKHRNIHIWAKPCDRPRCIYCANSKVIIKATYNRKLKHSRQGNRLVFLYLKVPKYYCRRCKRYFRHRFDQILPRLRSTEAYRLEVFEAHNGGVSQKQISRTHDIGCATVERWYQYFIKQRVSELYRASCPQILGIDEHFFTRKKGYATTLVDLKNHKVFDVVLGRTDLALKSYLNRLQGRDKVKVVVMDLSNTYRKIVKQYFPNAKIVADRFHVVRLVNQHFLELWKQIDPVGRKNRGLLKLMRRHEKNLKPEQRLKLSKYFELYPALGVIYQAKQQLMGFLLLKSLNAKKAKEMLPKFLQLIDEFANSPARAIANTIKSWLEPIVRMWRFTKSNGITEGFHTKMEMLSRRAYGFRNFENYRLRVLAHCGWNGVINRVKL